MSWEPRQVDAKAMDILAKKKGKLAELYFERYGPEHGILGNLDSVLGEVGNVNKFINIEIFDRWDRSGVSVPFIGEDRLIKSIYVEGRSYNSQLVYDNSHNLLVDPFYELLHSKRVLNDDELRPLREASFGEENIDPKIDNPQLLAELMHLRRECVKYPPQKLRDALCGPDSAHKGGSGREQGKRSDKGHRQ